MKRKLLMLPIMLLTFLFVFVGCSNSENAKNNNQEMDYLSYLKEQEEPNKFENLVKKHGQAEIEVNTILQDGTTYKYHEYYDSERSIHKYDDIIDIVEGDIVYGYEIDEKGGKEPFTLMFADNYDEFMQYYSYNGMYNYNEKEKLISGEIKDGIVYIRTTITAEAQKDYLAAYNYNYKDVKEIETEYEFDEKTKELLKIKSHVVMLDSQRKELNKIVRNMNAQKYQVDQKLKDDIFGQDTRTLTVITDAGTANEKKYTKSTKKGTNIRVYTGEDFEAKLYEDAKYTKETTVDKYADSTVYLKRVSNSNSSAENTTTSNTAAENKTNASNVTYPSKDNKRDLWNSKKGYSMTYNPSLFTVEDQDGVDTFKYNTSEKLKAPVYVSVQAHEDMDAQALADGIVLQSGIDGLKVEDTDFGADKIKTKNVYAEKEVNGVKQVQVFYAIPKGKGSLLVEIGSYVGAPQNIDSTFEEMLGTFKLK